MHEEKGTGEPICLELADALQLYAAIIGGTPAQAADQLRDQGALEGALGRPRSYANYEDADLTFLELNGYRVEAPDPDLADWILSFSSGTTPQQLAPLVRDAMRPVP